MNPAPHLFLNSFKIIEPLLSAPQEELVRWTSLCHAEAANNKESEQSSETIRRLFLRYAVKSNQISKRYFECSDILSDNLSEAQIYKRNPLGLPGSDISDKARFFSEKAFSVFQKLYPEFAVKPDHLIHVTCTGYNSPSSAQRIVGQINWNHLTAITHAYHMGCYASLPAIRLADGLVNREYVTNPNFKVDIVHTEMCGLHMNPSSNSPEQVVVQTLFGDGHIKYSAMAAPISGRNFKVLAIHEKIIADSEADMTWTPAAWGMEMTLSRDVPDKIKIEIKKFLSELIAKTDLSVQTVFKAIFAIHPGGPKIINAVQEVLELSDKQTKHSKKVLFERGNISSATLPHVWEALLNDSEMNAKHVISFAFGPGLTLIGSVFEVVL